VAGVCTDRVGKFWQSNFVARMVIQTFFFYKNGDPDFGIVCWTGAITPSDPYYSLFIRMYLPLKYV
jgi:hypothetical protein